MHTNRSSKFHRNITTRTVPKDRPEKIPTRIELSDYSFKIKVEELTPNQVVSKLIIPDLIEIFLIFSGLLLNYLIMQPITGLNLFNPYMLIFWGIFTLMLTTSRWGYTSIFQYLARQKTFDSKFMQGKHVVDFNISGMATSGLLIVLGVFAAGLI
ncbi:MAG: hypothetical protein ACC656_03770 [Candidatus Heimdallarchaeota archaeon]